MTNAIKGFEHKGQAAHSQAPLREGGVHPVPPSTGPQMAHISHPEVTGTGQNNRCFMGNTYSTTTVWTPPPQPPPAALRCTYM